MKTSFADFFLSCKECRLENPRSFYGSFLLGPFGKSQSLTIANALRRTLLTEIRGVSITGVHIDGVFHEYSTIEGVRESVLDILLNLKGIILKTSKPLRKPVYGYLNVRGPGIVRISDFKFPTNIQCVDPDQYVATLNENGKLFLKVQIFDFSSLVDKLSSFEKTSKFKQFEKSKKNERFSKEKTNFLLVESNVHSVLKVNYLIENLPIPSTYSSHSRSSLSTSEPNLPLSSSTNSNFDSHLNNLKEMEQKNFSFDVFQNSVGQQVIFLELWTNGSIHPRKALNLTLSSLKNIFDKFGEMEHVALGLANSFFQSDETLLKILKTFEYDFGFYRDNHRINLYDSHFIIQERLPSDLLDEPLFQFSSKSNHHKFEKFQKKDEFTRAMALPEKISMNAPLTLLLLPSRVQECLYQNHFSTIGDVVDFFSQEKNKKKTISGIGKFSYCLIKKRLKKLGFL